MADDTLAHGRVARVIGPVVDVEFPPGGLPEIYTALRIDVTLEGQTQTVTCEVAQHIGDGMVRAIALKPTDGMVRGAPVENTGSADQRPGGRGRARARLQRARRSARHLAGRDPRGRPLADPPPAAAVRGARAQAGDARDRDQGHRPARALRAGRQDRDVRRRRGREDRDHPGDDPPPGATARRRLGVRRRRRAHARGQRPVPGDDRVRRHQEHGARVRADGRAAGRSAPGRAVGAHDGRVLPRRRAQGRAAVRRQHLPVHAGGLGGLDAARPHAERRRLPADAGRRDGRPAGADHVDEGSFDHLAAGDLRAGRRHHRPGAAHGVRPPGRHHGALARHRVAGDLPRGRPAGLDQPHPRRAVRRAGALRHRPPRTGDPAALQGPAGHHRDPRRGRALGGGQGDRGAGAADPAVPVAAVLRGRAVHRDPRQVHAASTRRSRRSARYATASTTTCPSRRSCSSAGSRRPSRPRRRWSRPRRWRSTSISSRPNARSGPVRRRW